MMLLLFNTVEIDNNLTYGWFGYIYPRYTRTKLEYVNLWENNNTTVILLFSEVVDKVFKIRISEIKIPFKQQTIMQC